MYVTNT